MRGGLLTRQLTPARDPCAGRAVRGTCAMPAGVMLRPIFPRGVTHPTGREQKHGPKHLRPIILGIIGQQHRQFFVGKELLGRLSQGHPCLTLTLIGF